MVDVDIPARRATVTDADAVHYKADAVADKAAERGTTAYLNVLRAEARTAAREADSSLAAELLDIAKQQVAAGVGIALDVTRAESQLADMRARLIATRGDRDRSVLQLRHELSLADGAPLVITDSLRPPSAADVMNREEEILQRALNTRADYRAAVTQSDGARMHARAAVAERLPAISLYADHGSNGKETERMLGTYSCGVQVSLPIFDGLHLESRKAEEAARAREAEVTQGVSGNADVITASMTLNSARDLVIDALTSYHLARVALASAQGATTLLQ
jgi:outer membrane protein TolC